MEKKWTIWVFQNIYILLDKFLSIKMANYDSLEKLLEQSRTHKFFSIPILWVMEALNESSR